MRIGGAASKISAPLNFSSVSRLLFGIYGRRRSLVLCPGGGFPGRPWRDGSTTLSLMQKTRLPGRGAPSLANMAGSFVPPRENLPPSPSLRSCGCDPPSLQSPTTLGGDDVSRCSTRTGKWPLPSLIRSVAFTSCTFCLMP